MMSGTSIHRRIPPWVPPVLQAVGGDGGADQGKQSERGLHYIEPLPKVLKCTNAGREERMLFKGTKREKTRRTVASEFLLL